MVDFFSEDKIQIVVQILCRPTQDAAKKLSFYIKDTDEKESLDGSLNSLSTLKRTF